ncbi:helix-turn-helix domain-containing protein (plasmid) [Xenorhabdus stockiae]|uniref:helix-turn-helix domain-containing protein n=1 Tax=Xenorhabdus stockiae TaxID=351614 RepID=UPI003CF33DBC
MLKNNIVKNIGFRIKMRRKELGFTARHISEILDVKQQQISRFERGLNIISAAQLFQLAVMLDTPMDYFFQDCYLDFKDIFLEVRMEDKSDPVVIDFHSKGKKR